MANIGKNHKASKAELDMILELVIEMIIKGQTRTDILRHFANPENSEHTNELTKSERSVDYYLSKARIEIAKRYEPQKEKLKSLAIARLENLFKKNYQIQDYRECRSVIESISKITGMDAPIKNAQTDTAGNDKEFNITLNIT